MIRAHRAAGGARKGGLTAEENADKHALGRARGDYSTKLHVLTDGQGIPLSVTTTAGQRNGGPEFENIIASSRINIFRKAKRPDALAGDKGYSSRKIRAIIAKHSIQDVIPTRSNETRILDFNKSLYKQRNIVDRSIGWLKE